MCPGEPTIEQGHIDVGLSDFAVQKFYYNNLFIADIIAPAQPVPNRSDEYFVVDAREGLSDEHEEELMYGQIASELNFVIGKGQYACQLHGKRHLIADGILRNADAAVREMLKGDQYLLNNMRIRRERALWRLMTERDTYPAAGDHWLVAAIPWDSDIAVPKRDIDTACRIVEKSCGAAPNTLVVPPTTHDALTSNADIKDMIKTQRGDLYLRTGSIGDVLFNLRLIRAGSLFDTNAPFEASDIQYIWEDPASDAGDDWAWVGYVDPNPGLWTAGFATQFIWNMNSVAPGLMGRLRIYRDEEREGEWHEFRTDYQMLITNNEAAAMITQCKEAT